MNINDDLATYINALYERDQNMRDRIEGLTTKFIIREAGKTKRKPTKVYSRLFAKKVEMYKYDTTIYIGYAVLQKIIIKFQRFMRYITGMPSLTQKTKARLDKIRKIRKCEVYLTPGAERGGCLGHLKK